MDETPIPPAVVECVAVLGQHTPCDQWCGGLKEDPIIASSSPPVGRTTAQP